MIIMKRIQGLFLILFISLCLLNGIRAEITCPTAGKVVYCYYSGWAVYRPDGGELIPEWIDPHLCTHLLYSFAGISIDGHITSLDAHNDLDTDNGNNGYKRFTALKERNPCLKTLLAIGGWNESPEKFSIMAETEESRQLFASTILRFLVEYGFDGLDVDWEYPTQRGGIPEDRQNFVKVLELLKNTLSSRGRILTVAVASDENIIGAAYDIADICRIVDNVLVMAYEYQKDDATSMLSPLDAENDDGPEFPTVVRSIDKWINGGCPKEKLVLGIPAFGHTYTLKKWNVNPSLNGLGLAVRGGGEEGRFTHTIGFLGYYEICELLMEGDWYVGYRKSNANKWATKDDQWITYDDPETIATKMQYAVSKGLGGAMVWSIDTDDFQGTCGHDRNPILLAVNKGLGLDVSQKMTEEDFRKVKALKRMK